MSEHDSQSALITWWSYAHKRYGLPEFALFAVPNGGARHIAVAAKLKAEGVRKGIFDLCLTAPHNGFNSLWIEMKHGRNKLTPEQADFKAFIEGQGGMCAVCWDWQSARKEIEDYLGDCKNG